MTTKRHTPGADSHIQKERGAPPCENAPHGTTDTADSTKPFNPLRNVFAFLHDLTTDALVRVMADCRAATHDRRQPWGR